jgi:hypothetical protein
MGFNMKRSKASKSRKKVTGVTEEIIIPDQAVDFIVSRYLQERNKDDLPVVTGISTDTVETVLQLFLDWAGKRNYIKNGVLTLGGHPID